MRSVDAYAEAQWSPWPRVVAHRRRAQQRRALRRPTIITSRPQNPDDSGARAFRDTSPVAGAVWHATDSVNVYANYGEGFETPTFAELAYRTGGTGLNFGLEPATQPRGRGRREGAARAAPARRTSRCSRCDTDNEIVIDAATGGRTTYQERAATRAAGRRGAVDRRRCRSASLRTSRTRGCAPSSTRTFTTGAPPVVGAGRRAAAGRARRSRRTASSRGRRRACCGFDAALEVQYVDRLYVNERNTDFAPAYTIANARVGCERHARRARACSEFARAQQHRRPRTTSAR